MLSPIRSSKLKTKWARSASRSKRYISKISLTFGFILMIIWIRSAYNRPFSDLQEITSFSQQVPSTPQEIAPSFHQVNSVAQETTSTPQEATFIPQQIISVPQQVISIPQQVTSTTQQPTSMPQEATTEKLLDDDSIQDFVTASIQSTLDKFDPAGIQHYCSHDRWNTSLVFTCDRIFGGIGNIKQRILTCLLYAMNLGTAFVVPTISLRSNENLSLLEDNGEAALDYTFNRELFVSRLKLACPRMTVYDTIQEATRPDLEIFHFPSVLAYFLVCNDNPGFALNFGSLLMFPTHVYALAFSALYNLKTRFQFPVEAKYPFSHIPYLGVHLRTSMDAVLAGWTNYTEQSSRYLSIASSHSYPLIYVASGNSSSIKQFTVDAAAQSPPITVVTKEDLLGGDQLKELKSLAWDQAGLIDYILLESAGYFAGLVESSFTWSIAMARASSRGGEMGLCGENTPISAESVSWRDQWSEIMGGDPIEFKGRLWP